MNDRFVCHGKCCEPSDVPTHPVQTTQEPARAVTEDSIVTMIDGKVTSVEPLQLGSDWRLSCSRRLGR